MNVFSTNQTPRHYRRQFYLALGLSAFVATGSLAQTSAVQPDATFGTAGSVSVGLPGYGGTASLTGGSNVLANYDNLGQLVVTGTHTWVVGGYRAAPFFVYNQVRRFLPNGTLDTTFGTGGTVTAAMAVRGLAVQPDGKAVMVGKYSGNFPTIALARYDASGVLDPAFGTGGVVSGAQGSQDGELRRVLVLPGGKLLAIGWQENVPLTYVYRLLPNGQFDSSFSSNGAPVQYPGYFQTVTVQPDGRIILVSKTGAGVDVTRLLATGELDTGFGTGGRTTVMALREYQGTISPYETQIAGATVQPADGKIVLVGFAFSGSRGSTAALIRLNPDGSPDAAFNTAVATGVGQLAMLKTVLVQANGDLVVGGSSWSFQSTTAPAILARFSPAGILDASFGAGPGGVYQQAMPTNIGTFSEMEWQAPGQLLALGGYEALSGLNDGLRLTRYRVGGALATRSATTALGLQAAPVPTSGLLGFHYTLPAAAPVRLLLHDALGRAVGGQSEARPQLAGPQELTLDLQGLAPGLYFGTLEAGNLRQTVRLEVVR